MTAESLAVEVGRVGDISELRQLLANLSGMVAQTVALVIDENASGLRSRGARTDQMAGKFSAAGRIRVIFGDHALAPLASAHIQLSRMPGQSQITFRSR